jgi:DNA-binding MarR family transcriptional regulator
VDREKPWFETVSFPALLRHARNTYAVAMRKALGEAGFEDLPKNGLYVIGGMALGAGETPLGQLIAELRISKQAAGQLVDTLVARGYLERAVDEDDRRKLNVALTERGRRAAAVQAAGRMDVDAALIARVGAENVLRARLVLTALIDLGRAEQSDEEEV